MKAKRSKLYTGSKLLLTEYLSQKGSVLKLLAIKKQYLKQSKKMRVWACKQDLLLWSTRLEISIYL